LYSFTQEHGLADEPFNKKLVRLAMRSEAALELRSAITDRYERLTQVGYPADAPLC
jgi:hypothetical protein